MHPVGFVTLVTSEQARADAALLLASLREFGGEYARAPVWILHAGASQPGSFEGTDGDTHELRVDVDPALQTVFFGAKVSACARAEAELVGQAASLVWINPRALVLKPPRAFRLGEGSHAAVRPVHIQNIGSPAGEAPDPFWQALYDRFAVGPPGVAVESYVDRRILRPYFNTHLFAIDPALGLLQEWLAQFRALIADDGFMSRHAADEPHRIFLHQALFSVLLPERIAWEQIRILPPDYSYPLHLQHEISAGGRAAELAALTCPVYEAPFELPATLNGLPVAEPLSGWLAAALQKSRNP